MASLHGLGFPPSLIFLHSQFYSLSSGHTILPTCSLLPGILSQPGLVQLAPSCHSYFSFLAVGFLIDSWRLKTVKSSYLSLNPSSVTRQSCDSGRVYFSLSRCFSVKRGNSGVLRGLNELLCEKCLEQCLAHCKHYIHIIIITTTTIIIVIIKYLATNVRELRKCVNH